MSTSTATNEKTKRGSDFGLLVISSSEDIIGYLNAILFDWRLRVQPMAYLRKLPGKESEKVLSIVDMLEFDNDMRLVKRLKSYMKRCPSLILLNRHGRSWREIVEALDQPEKPSSKELLYDISQLKPDAMGLILGPFARFDIEGIMRACIAKFDTFTLADAYLCVPAERFGLTECGHRGGYEGIPMSVLKQYGEAWAIKSVSVVDVAIVDPRKAIILLLNGDVSVWDLENWNERERSRFPAGAGKGIAVAVSRGQTIIALSRAIVQFDATTGERKTLLRTKERPIWRTCVSEDGNLLAIGYENNSIEIFDVASMNCLRTIVAKNEKSLNCMLISSLTDQIFVAFQENPVIRLWNSHSGQYQETLEGHEDLVVAMSLSRDGKVLVSASESGELFFWNLDTGKGSSIYKASARPIKLRIGSNGVEVTCLFSDGNIVRVNVFSRVLTKKAIFASEQKVADFFAEEQIVMSCNTSGLISGCSSGKTEGLTAHISEFSTRK